MAHSRKRPICSSFATTVKSSLKQTLSLARLGGINLHASLLPKYRGAAPINWAIYHGEAETGVTVIHMTPELDAGPRWSQRRVAIGETETAPQVETRLASSAPTPCSKRLKCSLPAKYQPASPKTRNSPPKHPV